MSVVLHLRVWEIAIIKVNHFAIYLSISTIPSHILVCVYVYFMSFRTNAIYPFIEMKIYGVGKAWDIYIRNCKYIEFRDTYL